MLIVATVKIHCNKQVWEGRCAPVVIKCVKHQINITPRFRVYSSIWQSGIDCSMCITCLLWTLKHGWVKWRTCYHFTGLFKRRLNYVKDRNMSRLIKEKLWCLFYLSTFCIWMDINMRIMCKLIFTCNHQFQSETFLIMQKLQKIKSVIT